MKTTLEMAKEAGLPMGGRGAVPLWDEEIERLVELARADEREGCAKVCDEMRSNTPVGLTSRIEALFHAARNIRARGKP
jgi:hypothetical protein